MQNSLERATPLETVERNGTTLPVRLRTPMQRLISLNQHRGTAMQRSISQGLLHRPALQRLISKSQLHRSTTKSLLPRINSQGLLCQGWSHRIPPKNCSAAVDLTDSTPRNCHAMLISRTNSIGLPCKVDRIESYPTDSNNKETKCGSQ